jgi:hypothetical protein
MPVVLSERPAHASAQGQSTEKNPAGERQEVIERFHESVTTIAGLLGDMSTPLRRSAHNRERFLVEDAFAYTWKDSKLQLGHGDDEAAKRILRAQGASEPFLDAVRSLLQVETGSSPRFSEEQAKRFSVALRFAVHLSPDGGDMIYNELDKALHPSYSSCPLALINAYLAHKVRNAKT